MLKYFFIILLLISGAHTSLATEANISLLPIVRLMPSPYCSNDNPENAYVIFENSAVGCVPKDKLPENLKIGEAFRVSYSLTAQIDSPIPPHSFHLLYNVTSHKDPGLTTQLINITPSSADITSLLTRSAGQNIWILDLDDCILQDGLSSLSSKTVLGNMIEDKMQDTKNRPAGVLFITKRDQCSNNMLDRTIEELQYLFPALYAFSISHDNVLFEATNNPEFTEQYNTSAGPVIIMGDGTNFPCKGKTLLALLQTTTKELQERMHNLNFLCVDDQINNCAAYGMLSFQTIRFLPCLYLYHIEKVNQNS